MKKYIFILIFLLAISYALYTSMAQVKLETGLPNVPSGEIPIGQDMLAKYINYLFIFGLGLIAFLALGQMIFGGILYILAASNAVKVEDAKDHIKQALIGLGFILISYLFLKTINPDLVNLRNPSIVPQSFQLLREQTPEGSIIPGAGAPGTTIIRCGTTDCVSTESCINGACVPAAPSIGM